MERNTVQNNIVLIEGVDKSGKTTLLHDLGIELYIRGYDYVLYKTPRHILPKAAKDANAVYGAHSAVMAMADLNKDTLFISDRSYLSELAYSAVKRDYEAFDDLRYLELLSRPDILVIYVDTDEEVLKDRFISCGEESTKIDEILKIKGRYENALAASQHKICRIDGTADRQDNVDKALAFIQLQTINNQI